MHFESKNKTMLLRIMISAVFFGVSFAFSSYTALFFSIAAFIVIGFDIMAGAVKNLLRRNPFDEKFLMTVASLGAFAIGEWHEGAAVMLFYQVGELFQDMAVDSSRRSISELMQIMPDSANLEKDGKVVSVYPDEVEEGSVILVRAGEKVPLDGIVLSGEAELNTAALTGESLSRKVVPGDRVMSGCINVNGLLRITTTGTFEDSTVSKILELVESSAEKKAKRENFISRFARIYTPVVVGAALLVAIVPPIFFGNFSQWFRTALVFLVISCPCALVISVPLSFFGGIGGASKKGILIKGGNYLDAMAKAETVVFDKTGTLTEGTFEVRDILPKDITRQELLYYAAAAESGSDHPIARSICRAAGNFFTADSVQELAGMGIKAQVGAKTVLVGNGKLMDSFGIRYDAHGTVQVAIDGNYVGSIIISDTIKPEAYEAVKKIKKYVKKTVMLTGDSDKTARDVAEKLHIDEYKAELLPSGKVAVLEKLLGKGGTVIFCGDGINDAPVLRRADVGIAMGEYVTDAAIEASDVVLSGDDLSKIPLALKIAKKTSRIVNENIFIALVSKGLIMVLGLFGAANMWWAIFADVGVAILAVLNALRCSHIKEK